MKILRRNSLHGAAVVAWLASVWVLLWGNISAANILGGIVVAIVIRTLLPLPPVPVESRVHLWALVKLVAHVVWDLVVSSTQVALLAIRPGPPPRSAVVRTHMRVESELVLALTVTTLTLVPGSIVMEIDRTNRVIYSHVLDVRSEKDIRRFKEQVRRLEDRFIAAFESPDEPSAVSPSGGGVR
ncbi:Na+/H+ antiporter subunit E [Rhodococcus sp. X156]|uniref:Na+/H+ antiporter subunit E n=1 Tax=Rhodococcus sp. X156 TaxID=2499145 RepID=UPI000FDC4962|nr:Na+/H+ antiporter subunit E [Rhodococcus sp. X156]